MHRWLLNLRLTGDGASHRWLLNLRLRGRRPLHRWLLNLRLTGDGASHRLLLGLRLSRARLEWLGLRRRCGLLRCLRPHRGSGGARGGLSDTRDIGRDHGLVLPVPRALLRRLRDLARRLPLRERLFLLCERVRRLEGDLPLGEEHLQRRVERQHALRATNLHRAPELVRLSVADDRSHRGRRLQDLEGSDPPPSIRSRDEDL